MCPDDEIDWELPEQKRLTFLREQMARPWRGKPARYEVSFRVRDIELAQGTEASLKWFREECQPVVKNLTGGRARYAGTDVFVDDKADAQMISLFFTGFVCWVLDWKDMTWVEAPKSLGNLPDL